MPQYEHDLTTVGKTFPFYFTNILPYVDVLKSLILSLYTNIASNRAHHFLKKHANKYCLS